MQDPNPSGTNEGKFMDGLRAFMDEVPHLVAAEKRKDLEKLVFYYENPATMKSDPLLTLPPSEAKVMLSAQQRVAALLSEHPFFRRVAEIAHARFSQDVQEIIDVNTYITQLGLGITPEFGPREEAFEIVEQARKDVRRGRTGTSSQQPRSESTERRSSHFDGILQVFKDNW